MNTNTTAHTPGSGGAGHSQKAGAGPAVESGRQSFDVFEQDCADYLRFLGFDAQDGVGTNAPYRPEADSRSFYTNGVFWYDHSHGEGGNVWQLALRMNEGNRDAALRSLYECAGLPYRPNSAENTVFFQRLDAEQALAIAREKFGLSDQTPQDVRDYLASRGITKKSWPWLAYIPKGQPAAVLTPEQMELTGLGHREGLLILWYLRHGHPVYYCTRSIAEKEFKKAPVAHLQHPIWNVDVLYRAKDVVWAEGFFDCLSLIELGIEVCGEITCNPVHAHLPELEIALRWRQNHMPDGRFTICLDNDALKDGHRPGNEAAAKLAATLFSGGIDQWWVKHDPGAEKVDLNDLHKAGRDSEIHRLLASAKRFSEVVQATPEIVRNAFFQAMAEGDGRTASTLVDKYVALKPKDVGAKAIQGMLSSRIPYQTLYRGIRLYLYGDDVYVLHDRPHYRDGGEPFDCFKRSMVADNIREFQRNPALSIGASMLDIPPRRPYYRVTSDPAEDSNSGFNLFRPAQHLLQAPVPGVPIPPMFDLVLDNTAGKAEKEWLLNHMAVYVQTMAKPRTIPVAIGGQGSGKNTLFEMLGRGIGGFMPVGKDLIECSYNDYLLHPVILLDELVSSNSDARSIKSKLKSFINEEQTIHSKFLKPYGVRLNSYIAIMSNEHLVNVPVIIEADDRRYSVITGGKDLNLENVPAFDRAELERQLPDFMLYLLSRPINAKMASTPLDTPARRRLMEQGEDVRITAVREWVEEHRGLPGDSVPLSGIRGVLHQSGDLRQPISPSVLRNILESIGLKVIERNHQLCCLGLVGVPKVAPLVDIDGPDEDPQTIAGDPTARPRRRPETPTAPGEPCLSPISTQTSTHVDGSNGSETGVFREFSRVINRSLVDS